jgi:hypothetical protein
MVISAGEKIKGISYGRLIAILDIVMRVAELRVDDDRAVP